MQFIKELYRKLFNDWLWCKMIRAINSIFLNSKTIFIIGDAFIGKFPNATTRFTGTFNKPVPLLSSFFRPSDVMFPSGDAMRDSFIIIGFLKFMLKQCENLGFYKGLTCFDAIFIKDLNNMWD